MATGTALHDQTAGPEVATAKPVPSPVPEASAQAHSRGEGGSDWPGGRHRVHRQQSCHLRPSPVKPRRPLRRKRRCSRQVWRCTPRPARVNTSPPANATPSCGRPMSPSWDGVWTVLTAFTALSVGAARIAVALAGRCITHPKTEQPFGDKVRSGTCQRFSSRMNGEIDTAIPLLKRETVQRKRPRKIDTDDAIRLLATHAALHPVHDQ